MRAQLFFLSSCLFLSVSAFSQNFKTYCFLQKHPKTRTSLPPEIARTVEVLLETASETSPQFFSEEREEEKAEGITIPEISETLELCQRAEDALNSKSILDLSGKELTDLKALAGLRINVLNVSHNNLVDLWGVELLSELMVLVAHHNELRNISALAPLQNLIKVDLNYNQLHYASALKEKIGLTLEIQENPLSKKTYPEEDKPEFDYLDAMLFIRSCTGGGNTYDFRPDMPVEELRDIILRAAERGDTAFFRTLFTHEVIRDRLKEAAFLKVEASQKARKMVLALSESENLADFLIFTYKKTPEILFKASRSNRDFLDRKRKQLITFFEHFLMEGTGYPHRPEDLESLGNFLKKSMERKAGSLISHSEQAKWKLLDPRAIENDIISWRDSLVTPPSMSTGFMSL